MPPFSLSDDQLHFVMTALGPLDPSKRATAMERIAAQFRLAGLRRLTDNDLKNAIDVALRGLVIKTCV